MAAILGWLADDLTVLCHETDLASELGLEQAAFTAAVATLVRAKLVMLGSRRADLAASAVSGGLTVGGPAPARRLRLAAQADRAAVGGVRGHEEAPVADHSWAAPGRAP
jgi:hypothetical protein